VNFPLVIFALACLALSASAQQNSVTINAYNVIKEEVTLSTEQWKNAYNSNDVEKLAEFYAEDADYISPHVPGLMIHGRGQIKENFRRGIAGGGHIDSIAVQRSGSSCDLAYLICAYQATNSGVTVRGKNVLVMKRVGTRWLILTHASIVKD
jgi:ketosteroid isomerase-like protein